MLIAATTVVLLLGASDVSLDVSADVKCVTGKGLQTRLEGRGIQVRAKGTPGLLDVTVRTSDERTVLQASRGTERFSRTLPSGTSECSAVERIVAALIEAWANPPRVGAGSNPTTRDGGAGSVVDAGMTSAVEPDAGTPPLLTPTAVTPPIAVARPQRVTPPLPREPPTPRETTIPRPEPAPLVTVEAADPPDASVVVEPADAGIDAGVGPLDAGVAAPTPVAVPAATPWFLEVAGLGGALLETGASARFAGSGSLFVRGGVGPWAVLAEGSFETNRTASQQGVTATADAQSLSLGASAALAPTERLKLDLAIGARGWRVAARATGLTDPRNQTVFAPGAFLSAGASFQLVGPLALHARLGLAWRPQQLQFTAEPLGTLLTFPTFTVTGQLGLLLRWPWTEAARTPASIP